MVEPPVALGCRPLCIKTGRTECQGSDDTTLGSATLLTSDPLRVWPSGPPAFRTERPLMTVLPLRRMAFVLLLVPLAACAQFDGSRAPQLDAAGSSTRGIYPVTTANAENVRKRAVETLNARRAAAGLSPVEIAPVLNNSADRHSASMSAQGRAWAFGANGDTPLQRAREAGFQGTVLGEVISETYENEVQAIDFWLADPAQRAILMNPAARYIGLGIHQEESMKLWWTLTVAS